MEYRQLGRSDLQVSALCLGSMTWGEQNSEAEGFAQIDRAKACGINFLDTAEMYPVPPRRDTYGATERIIGNYFKARGDRADWVLASKVAGPGNGIDYIRGGQLKHNRQHIVAALDDSLEAPADRLDRPLPAALAGAQHQLLRPARLSPPGTGLHPAAGNPGSAGRTGQGRQDPPHRPVQRDGLGHHEVPATGRPAGPAARGVDPEPLQPAQPQLRGRPGRSGHARTVRPAGLLAAGLRHALGQIRERRAPGQCAASPCSAASPATPTRRPLPPAAAT